MHDESNSSSHGPKIQKEKKTVEKLIRLYCTKKHRSSSEILCSECRRLLEYSILRLDACQYQEDKPTCLKCPIHCFNPLMRKEIRRVMRYSGPRLVLRAPLDWIRHQIRDRVEKDVN